jgi:Glycosyltransferase (GlcNAc)
MLEMEKPIQGKSKIKKSPRSGDSGMSNGKLHSSRKTGSSWTLVLQHSASSITNPQAIEVGLLLSFLFLAIYIFGFYETIQHLPDSSAIATTPDFAHHVGENFNVAVNEWAAGANRTTLVGLQQRDMQQQQQQPPEQKQPELKQQPEQQQPLSLRRGGGGGGLSNSNNANEPEIPEAHWPVSLRNEPENFENLIHPGDKETIMSVPKFWSKPIHNNKLMTYETAMRIGTCSTPDAVNFPQHPYQRGDACPVHNRTIFVAIASYRDFQCRYTVESAFMRASNPDRIRVAIVDQIVDGEDVVCNAPIYPCSEKPEQALCKYKDRVDVYEMEAELSIGPVFARHLGHRMYRGEYYSTQSDAHVTFTQNWDDDIISQVQSTGDEMAVLSTYLTDVQGSISPDGKSLRNTRPIMCNTYYEGGPQGKHLRHGSQPEREPTIKDQPMLQPWYVFYWTLARLVIIIMRSRGFVSFKHRVPSLSTHYVSFFASVGFSLVSRWAAGYSFSRGHFLVNVRYDPWQPMIFQGEEMSIGT